MKAYWASTDPGNFGDVLTPLLFRRLAGVQLEWVEREHAELFAIGSIAELIPRGFQGFVLGTGCMFDAPIELDTANVLALRGVLTARLAGIRAPLYADMGLLAADLAPKTKRDIPIGTVRAGGDLRPPIGIRLDPLDDPQEMIALAARCQRIVSSSLHGLILADGLGTMNMWDPWPVDVTFKFRDYASAYSEPIEPYRWRFANQAEVASKKAALRAALASIA